MAFALVGTAAAVSTGAVTTAVTPAWGTSQNRTAGNLLILWVASAGATTTIATPSGWSPDIVATGANSVDTGIFHRIATGADAAPTVAAITGSIISAQLAEFSGNSPAVFDHSVSASTIATSPLVGTIGVIDQRLGELVCYAFNQLLSVAAVGTATHTLNNGMVATATANTATSTTTHYSFGWSTTTSIGSGDQDSVAFTTTNTTGAQLAIASYKLPSLNRSLMGVGL